MRFFVNISYLMKFLTPVKTLQDDLIQRNLSGILNSYDIHLFKKMHPMIHYPYTQVCAQKIYIANLFSLYQSILGPLDVQLFLHDMISYIMNSGCFVE